jgi:Glycosyltransferase (GlcNAc)
LFIAGGEPSQHIAPYSNRLVIFRSDGVEHQVLTSLRRPRLALTVWMYGRLKGQQTSPPQSIDTNAVSANFPSSAKARISAQPLAGPPLLPVDESGAVDSFDGTIFVSIPSYRDPETGPTLRNLMATARNGSRVFVGLVLQVDSTSDKDRRRILELLPTEEPWYRRQVRVLALDARHAAGPCPARRLDQSLFRGEEYLLSIDSHMRFRPDWDVYLIQQLHACPRHRPLYPVGYELPNRIPNETRTRWGTSCRTGSRTKRGGLFWSRGSSTATACFDKYPASCWRTSYPTRKDPSRRTCSRWDSTLPYPPSLRTARTRTCRSCSSGRRAAWRSGCSFVDAICTPVESVCYHLWSRSYSPQTLNEESNDDPTRTATTGSVHVDRPSAAHTTGRSFGTWSRSASRLASIFRLDGFEGVS